MLLPRLRERRRWGGTGLVPASHILSFPFWKLMQAPQVEQGLCGEGVVGLVCDMILVTSPCSFEWPFG